MSPIAIHWGTEKKMRELKVRLATRTSSVGSTCIGEKRAEMASESAG